VKTNNELQKILICNLHKYKNECKELLSDVMSMWLYEDPIYRFYHHSFKVFWMQDTTIRIVKILIKISPNKEMNKMFLKIIKKGTGKRFTRKTNENWDRETRSILEAFFHAKFFLEMCVKYSKTKKSQTLLESGYAALLYLYNIR